jgi:replicative DNA helicase
MVNLDAERAILGAVLINQGTLNFLEGLLPSDFYDSRNGIIFAAMRIMHDEKEKIDQLLLLDKIRSIQPTWADKINDSYIDSLLDATPTSANAPHYARTVIQKARARELCATIDGISQRLKDGEDPMAMSAEVSQAAEIVGCESNKYATINDTFDLLEKYQDGSAVAYLDVGFRALDRHAPGAGEFIVIAARPSVGKTALGVALAENLARTKHVLYASIEMTGVDINFRRLASRARMSVVELKRKGGVNEHQWEKIMQAFESMKDDRLHVISGDFGLPEIKTTIRAARDRWGIEIAFIDQLANMKIGRGERQDIEIGKVTRDLGRMSKDLGVTIFLLHQINREGDKEERPAMRHLKDSGAIEQDADAIWLLWRDSYKNPEAGKEFEIRIAKNRNGLSGIAKLYFDEHTGRFEDLEGRYGN